MWVLSKTKLTTAEEDWLAAVIHDLAELARSLKKRGMHLAAAEVAVTGQTYAHLRYNKGQVGYAKFDEFLKD